MPRIGILDLSYHWPPTGGSWVDIAEIAKGLSRHGARVRLFVPRVDTGGLKRGLVAAQAPVDVETIPTTLLQFHALALPRLLASRLREWLPDYVLITNWFSMGPWLVRALSEFRIYLRVYGYEMLCPNYMSLWPRGRVAAWSAINPTGQICPKNYVATPFACTRCAIRGMGKDLLPKWMNPFSHEYVASLAFLPVYATIMVKSLNSCSGILVSNAFTGSMLERWREKVIEVPGGVDTNRFSPRASAQGTDGDPVVLMAGRVEDPRKGYGFFRDAVHLLADRGHRLSAQVTDPRYDGNSPHIKSLGWIPYDEMPSLYRNARVVVAPTLWPEPFGLVALEAMASGVPVVASSIGGFKNLVLDGKTGFLVPPGKPSVLADRIALLLRDDDLWEEMSHAARDRAMEFAWHKIVTEHYLPLFGMD